ncbi:P-loop containing nucleoside triphosphate hydrolase protein [Mycena sanguinolenta]|uniref:DNA 3'-5' helicase n=1 Tax=Mycena sanguinolenta TaxID=230812 RepID=A0A8H7CFR6_9AGAR|nr:P-loop containing nucleoside triphosphate hydrolase protein [Mycena sanguinolenta]
MGGWGFSDPVRRPQAVGSHGTCCGKRLRHSVIQTPAQELNHDRSPIARVVSNWAAYPEAGATALVSRYGKKRDISRLLASQRARRPAAPAAVRVGERALQQLLHHLRMPPVQSRLDSHRRDAAKSAKILQKAREDASKSRGYQSAPTRARIRNEFMARNNGMIAHEWQVDIGEALHLGLDCSLIAGTGAGKTMPFVMPLFEESDKVIIIISPLNALEADQAARFRKMGLSAVAVNGDTYSSEVHKEIQELKHRVIITSPDMCLQHDKFRQLISTPAFSKKIAAFVVDEAHCISQWGDDFRTEYAKLGTLRAFVPLHVPFLMASATLPPLVLAQVRQSLHISPDTSYHVNLGTDRPNIAWFMRLMKGAKSDLEALDFLISAHDSEDAIIELLQTMVFFDDINLAMDALEHLRDRLPPRLRGAQTVQMDKFRKGEIKILLTTEAAGMGCDIPHVEQVVQFMVPASLSIWMQRAGRAGRNFLIAARAILLVQPSVFKEVNSKTPTDEVTFQKSVEAGLRAWIETEECRREVVDEYFNNGTSRMSPTGICCDNCLRKLSPDHPLLASRPGNISAPPPLPPAQYRRDAHLKGVRDLLTKWRADQCATIYRRRPWGPKALLPDEILTKFATRAHLKSPEDLIGAGWSPTHAQRHGTELLAAMAEYDTEFKRQRDENNKRKRDEKKAETAKRQKLSKELQRAEKARLKHAAPPAPPKAPKARKSRAKPKPAGVLQPTIPNLSDLSSPVPTYPDTFPAPLELLQSITRPNLPFTPARSTLPLPPFPFAPPIPSATPQNYDMYGTPQLQVQLVGPETPYTYTTPQNRVAVQSLDSGPVLAATSFYGARLPPPFLPEYFHHNLDTSSSPESHQEWNNF